MEGWLVILGIGGFFWGITILFAHIDNKAKIIGNKLFESRKRELESAVEQKRLAAAKEIDERTKDLQKKEVYVSSLRKSFEGNYYKGRRWLAEFVAEADKAFDDQISNYLQRKKHPAYNAAEAVKEAKAEKRAALKQIKFLEYQLKSYKEYFPFLEEFEEAILAEQIDFSSENADSVVDNIDRAAIFLSKEEFEKLPVTERNQLALDRYIDRHKEKWEIGRLYERFLGYKYESEGWEVSYIGAVKGFEDMGRDLICKKDGKIHIVQAKCWAAEKTIHEKHVFQLFGTTLCYEMENSLLPGLVTPVFTSTTKLSPVATAAAQRLGVVIKQVPLDKKYPMIKCNVNQGNKIYHLPFDQQYDRVKIQDDGELYVRTVAEAEKKGFRRAKRYFGNATG
jgi:hypothetical protein